MLEHEDSPTGVEFPLRRPIGQQKPRPRAPLARWTVLADGAWERHDNAGAAALSAPDWQTITVGERPQGERNDLFACEPVYDNREQRPYDALVELYLSL